MSTPSNIPSSSSQGDKATTRAVIVDLSQLSLEAGQPRGPPQRAANLANIVERGKPRIFLQERCYDHRYIRSRDLSAIVERPQRLRAVALGVSAAAARLEDELSGSMLELGTTEKAVPNTGEQLARALSQLDITEASQPSPFCFVHSKADIDLLSHPATLFIHGRQRDPQLEYLLNLKDWAAQSEDNIAKSGSELPLNLPQGDLYLCPESYGAISGAVGTVCEAIDAVVEQARTGSTTSDPAFVVIRPPGHHCGESSPSGFCFVNNVAIGAAHAHLTHGINRVIIFDIDLHHGNGTQKIAWRINGETRIQEIRNEQQGTQKNLKIYYSSLHDILSYPCEDGDADLVRDASISIHGPHGQYIENVHLRTYGSEDEFHLLLYPAYHAQLFGRARRFIRDTGATSGDTLVLISCGFDACEHEHDYMSRHGRKVPASFYERFTRDAKDFAGEFAGGKLISVLEGGYSDRALLSGVMSHLAGLAKYQSRATPDPHVQLGTERYTSVRAGWWSVDNLNQLEKVLKKPKGRKPRQSGPETDALLARTQEIFTMLDRMPDVASRHHVPPPATATGPRMSLRDRKKPSSPNRDGSTQRSRSLTPQKRRSSVDNIKKLAVPMGEYTSSAPVSTRPANGDHDAGDTTSDDVSTPKHAIRTATGTGEAAPLPLLADALSHQPLKIKIKIPRPSAS